MRFGVRGVSGVRVLLLSRLVSRAVSGEVAVELLSSPPSTERTTGSTAAGSRVLILFWLSFPSLITDFLLLEM